MEHDLSEIWKTVERCCRKGLEDADVRPRDVVGIGITNQRETTALWNRETGVPLARAIVWQDRRTAEACAELKARGVEPLVRETTGLVVDPYFSATKIRWLLDHVEGARPLAETGKLCFGTIDSWLVYRLTGRGLHVTDATNASRTLLYDLRFRGWSEAMLELFEIPPQILPEVRSCAEVYGATQGMESLPDGIPVAGIAGDQQAALFGQACFRPGEAKCTYGTGAFLLMNRQRAGGLPQRAAHHRGLAAGRCLHLRAGGLELRRRRGGSVAARRVAGDQEVGAGGEARPQREGLG